MDLLVIIFLVPIARLLAKKVTKPIRKALAMKREVVIRQGELPIPGVQKFLLS